MQPAASMIDPKALDAFVKAVGSRLWRDRLSALASAGAQQTRAGRNVLQRHCIELTIERLRIRPPMRPPSVAERWITTYAAQAVAALDALTPTGREALLTMLRGAISGEECLVAPFHLLRTAAMQRVRGFAVQFASLEEGAPFDLLIERNGVEAEIVCDMVSAEAGRGVHRGAWFHLMDRVDPELQTWLRAHPGRYLLKMTLPKGLRSDGDSDLLATLHTRITEMLKTRRHADGDEAAVLRLDPLMLAAAQADELGLMPRLRQEFGPEAHLSVTTAGGGIFVMAARAGQENEVAGAVRRRLDAVAPARLTGTRPGILAMFIEDTDRAEWRNLREKLELEGETRQFMTHPEARSVVAVTCTSRLELFGLSAPDAEPEGELRFRNPAHPAAKTEALAPAVLSSI
jgi:hypothetical protein